MKIFFLLTQTHKRKHTHTHTYPSLHTDRHVQCVGYCEAVSVCFSSASLFFFKLCAIPPPQSTLSRACALSPLWRSLYPSPSSLSLPLSFFLSLSLFLSLLPLPFRVLLFLICYLRIFLLSSFLFSHCPPPYHSLSFFHFSAQGEGHDKVWQLISRLCSSP